MVVDLSSGVRHETHTLKKEPLKGLSPRIYVDLMGARLSPHATRQILVRDRLLRRVRIGQFSSNVVRVVLDLESFTDHKTFLLPDPHRLVVDVYGRRNGRKRAPIARGKTILPRVKGVSPAGIPKIVLDPGHGGRDPGAIGPRGILEKDIVLSLAKKLARKLRKELAVKVILTRQDDSYVPLEDRTAIANAENNHQLDVDQLVVAQATVGKTLTMRRFRARARGRGTRIDKPVSNLTIVVAEREDED
ncbi:MAG: N-acetylmuramoyl-L-alanine amidase [Deltaproteobacteria bacterium]|nr:N-acetylmuramoyl-L-alanine amidase [Deltaproteobacteria bacterium]